MKTIDELKNTPHLTIQGILPNAPMDAQIYYGWIDLYDFRGSVVFGYNEHGTWEHVSVSHNNKRKLPSWDDMCRIKEMFWGKDVTVCQFHPAENAYVHGVMGENTNILHLWRPIDGNWGIINEDLMKTL